MQGMKYIKDIQTKKSSTESHDTSDVSSWAHQKFDDSFATSLSKAVNRKNVSQMIP